MIFASLAIPRVVALSTTPHQHNGATEPASVSKYLEDYSLVPLNHIARIIPLLLSRQVIFGPSDMAIGAKELKNLSKYLRTTS